MDFEITNRSSLYSLFGVAIVGVFELLGAEVLRKKEDDE